MISARAHHDPVREVPPRVDTCRIDPAGLRGLAAYYLSKRIRCQRKYFERQATRYHRTERWLRHLPLACFFGSIVAAFVHFAIGFLEGWLGGPEPHDASWHLAAVGGLTLAAILPVVGAGVRAYRGAHEFARSAALFNAKASAMQEFERRVASHPITADTDAPWLVRTILECESFLEAEHREWLRLMLETEWFG